MIKIRLIRTEWLYDKRASLGKGAFAEVMKGTSADRSREVAVKRVLKVGDWPTREESIAQLLDGGARQHVVPVLDYGRERGDLYLVMPLATTTLAAESKSRRFNSKECARVLLEIVSGLEEVGKIVHRDLQPANVLLLDGKWQLADFGLARTTDAGADITVREHFTPAYAAPERWRLEDATSAGDLYSVGCIGYLLLQGRPPFGGDRDALRRAHLEDVPPPLDGVDPLLALLLTELLKKDPRRRPSRTQTLSMLNKIVSGQSATYTRGDELLRSAAVVAAREVLEAGARAEEARRRADSQRASAIRGWEECAEIAGRMTADLASIEGVVTSFSTPLGWARWSAELGWGTWILALPSSKSPFPDDSFPRSGWKIVLGGSVRVRRLDL